MLFMFRNSKGIWRLRWKLLIVFAIVIVLVKSISTIRSNSQNDLQSTSHHSSLTVEKKEPTENQQIDTKDNEREGRINWSPHGKININNEDAGGGGVKPDEKAGDKIKAPDVPVYNDDGDYPLPKYDKILNEKEG